MAHRKVDCFLCLYIAFVSTRDYSPCVSRVPSSVYEKAVAPPLKTKVSFA